jgi:hypothetical protein
MQLRLLHGSSVARGTFSFCNQKTPERSNSIQLFIGNKILYLNGSNARLNTVNIILARVTLGSIQTYPNLKVYFHCTYGHMFLL